MKWSFFSKCFVLALLALLALLAQHGVTSQDTACSNGVFCTYQCHCNNQCQNQDGLCPSNAKCDMGWFGLRCQYLDLVTRQGVTIVFEPQQTTTAWLTDRDDSTCNTDLNLQSVTVSWDREYPLTWLRIVMAEPTMLSTVRLMYKREQSYKECEQENWSRIGQGTVDIRCENKVMMKSLKVVGNITSLCSLHISGGRNIAYKQSATQSSTYSDTSGFKYEAGLAVDGNSNTDSELNRCSNTNDNDTQPRFDLKFNTAYNVHRFVLFNRGGLETRLTGFRLASMDEHGKIVDNYKDTPNTRQLIYYINSNDSYPIVSISVNETIITSINFAIVTLCEVEAFGECPPGKWSLPCTKQCNTSCPTSCHRDDGSCNTVCAGYSNPPECSHACVSTKWGINCANDCSTRCVNTSCDSKTGHCDRGCLGYIDPPHCTLSCSQGSWGLNCSQLCSKNCMTNSCNVFTGACDQGCKAGYQLPGCTHECSTGYFGVNCSSKCNNCDKDVCNSVTGDCNFGCQEGFQLPNCSTECNTGTYGRNCSLKCSPNCINGTCGNIKGYCICRMGFEGNLCEKIQDPGLDSKSFGSGIGAGIGIMVILGILTLVIVVLCIELRKRSARPRDQVVNVLTYDKRNTRDDDLHVYEQVTADFQETPASYKPKALIDIDVRVQQHTAYENVDTTSN